MVTLGFIWDFSNGLGGTFSQRREICVSVLELCEYKETRSCVTGKKKRAIGEVTKTIGLWQGYRPVPA